MTESDYHYYPDVGIDEFHSFIYPSTINLPVTDLFYFYFFSLLPATKVAQRHY